ncbi:MAG: ATPase [Mesorhizobium sp.]|nr:MAG: ATPase [Mesorhizobium sp.]
MEALVLGLDGGGTKTHLVVTRQDGRIVLGVAGAGVNPMDNPQWRRDLENLLRHAVPMFSSIRFAVLGLPGYAEVESVSRTADDVVDQLLPVPHRNENDVRVALDGAFLGGPGTLVLAGTGAMAMARGGDGRITRVGGWGETFSDEGGAYWIGHQAMRQASRALDGRLDAPAFAAALLAEIGAESKDGPEALMGWFLSLKHARSGIAALARLVDRLADTGDATAVAIMTAAAAELTSHLETAQRLSGQTGQTWSAAGSVFQSRTIVDLMSHINSPYRPAALVPVGGAVWSALQTAGIEPGASFVETFTSELARVFAPSMADPAGSSTAARVSNTLP